MMEFEAIVGEIHWEACETCKHKKGDKCKKNVSIIDLSIAIETSDALVCTKYKEKED